MYFTKLAIVLGSKSLILEGQFTLSQVAAVVDRWYAASVDGGATPEEQAALAARAGKDADQLHRANEALTTLATDTP